MRKYLGRLDRIQKGRTSLEGSHQASARVNDVRAAMSKVGRDNTLAAPKQIGAVAGMPNEKIPVGTV